MEHPVFSIVIPVYNTVRELERCVNSITEQLFTNFEIILVDDGSKDGSGELCDQLAEKDARIVVIHKENGGCSSARNAGIRAACGEYLMFVDSDDMWDDTKALDELNDIIQSKQQIDVICFGVRIYNENDHLVKVRKPERISDDAAKERILQQLIYSNQYFSASYVKVLRRAYFLKNELFFIKGLLSEDIEWSARVIISCKSIAVYPNAFYKRIVRSEGSITSSIGRKNILDILESIENGVQYVHDHSENNQLQSLYLEYWAYQYAMLLGLVSVAKHDTDYSSILRRLKRLEWLLKYDHVGKVRAVRVVVSVVGLKMAMNVLSIYYRYKGR